MIQLVCSSINEHFLEHEYKVVQPVTTAEHRQQRELHLENKRAKSAEKKAALLLMGLTESLLAIAASVEHVEGMSEALRWFPRIVVTKYG